MLDSRAAAPPRPNFWIALALACALVAAGQRWRAMPGHDPEDVWLGFALAASVWSWLCVLQGAAGRLLSPVLARAAALLLAAAFYLSLCAELAYSYFYSVAEQRELSLLSVGVWDGLRLLFGQLLTPRAILLFAVLMLLAHAAAAFWSWRGPTLPAGARKAGFAVPLALTSLTLFGGLEIHERIRSPFADLGREVAFLISTPQLTSSTTAAPFDVRTLDKSRPDDLLQRYGFDNVLVFVMETMIARDLEEESRALPETSFLRRALAQTHRYTQYFGNNQDSRTGMLDMLTSRLIPYEAYADNADPYRFVSRLPSLVDRFNTRGYESAYVVSHADREEVISDLPWKQVLLLPNAEVDALRNKLLCVTVYEFEYGCEDRAILPKVFDVLDQHSKVFLFQEFIWGHDPEYNEISGRSNADYYSAYLDAIVEHLRETDKLDRTLIVLTSDHGYRGHATLSERYAYHIPLWFYATRFSAHEDPRLFSHLDFRDLLLYELDAAPAPRAPDPFVMVVGPTGISSLTVLDAAGELVLIRNRGERHFLLTHRLAPDRHSPTLQPAAFARFFEDYRNSFDALARPLELPEASARLE